MNRDLLPPVSFLTVIFGLALGIAGMPRNFGATKGAGPQHRDIIVRERRGNQVTSSNWSGYAITGPKGSVTDVKGSWKVSALSCGPATAYSATWVGIDGYGSNTVEQIGTEADCVNGQANYYSWYEFYPHNYYTIESAPIKAGDVVSAEVTYNGGKFVVSLSVNSDKPFSISTKLNQAERSSAEWIVEAPYSGGVLPLADFQAEDFGVNYTGVTKTNNAVISNASGPIGSFSPADDVINITMTADNGMPKAVPSPLLIDEASFSDTWYEAGP